MDRLHEWVVYSGRRTVKSFKHHSSMSCFLFCHLGFQDSAVDGDFGLVLHIESVLSFDSLSSLRNPTELALADDIHWVSS